MLVYLGVIDRGCAQEADTAAAPGDVSRRIQTPAGPVNCGGRLADASPLLSFAATNSHQSVGLTQDGLRGATQVLVHSLQSECL